MCDEIVRIRENKEETHLISLNSIHIDEKIVK